MMRKFLGIIAGLLLCVSSLAQQPASSTFGLSEDDAIAVRQIRHKMAQIRKRRPTVALVLSGGGAKGAATVGALKYMERFELPIDMVVGTSIGGLLGGMYAMGYDATYLDSLIHNLEWDMILSDKVAPQYVPYARTRYKEKYMFSFPFFYRTEDYEDFLKGDLPFSSGRSRQLRLGADETGATSLDNLIKGNLLGSLPSGFVFGENVNHLISSHTVGYSDSTDFFKMPIPFACVATDMASRRAKIWHSGSMNLAMRSTMSIPGLFAPVRTEGMVLVDGGMRNNFPVNIARAMGADIVIGIDLSTESYKADQIQNLGGLLMSSIDLFANDAFEQNVSQVDIHVHPNMEGFNMLSFNKVAIDTMEARGYRAAMEKEPEFRALRSRLGKEKFQLQAKPAVDIGEQMVVIEDVQIVGVPPREAEYLKSKMFVKPGSIVNRDIIENDIAVMFGKGAYDYINYELRGKEEPYTLRIACKRGPMHQIGFGARIDSEDLVSLLLNIGLNTNSIYGSSLDITSRISANPFIDLHYALNAPHFATFNVRAIFRYTDRNNFLSGTNRYNISFLMGTQEIFASNMHWSSLDVKLGFRNQVVRVNRILSSDVVGDYQNVTGAVEDHPSTFLEGRVETLDNGYFPTKGVSAGLRGDFISRHFEADAPQKWMGIVSADGRFPVTMGRFTLIPQGYLRFVWGDNIPIIYSNVIGGDMAGRYVEQQMPFIGISNAAFRRDHIVMARMDARLRLGKNHYVSLIGNVSYDFEDFAKFDEGEAVGGVGLSYGYNSIVGPFKATVSWNTLNKRPGFYLSFGKNF